eukprot:10141808-Alexandrium_andersonii.AAC.1
MGESSTPRGAKVKGQEGQKLRALMGQNQGHGKAKFRARRGKVKGQGAKLRARRSKVKSPGHKVRARGAKAKGTEGQS